MRHLPHPYQHYKIMQIQTVTLRNVKLETLKSAFKRSLMLKNNEALNFELSSALISNVACNTTEAFFKKWSIITSEVAEFDKEFESIKVSIYKGDAFVQNVLSYFGESCDIEVEHFMNEARKLTISNQFLKIVIAAAPVKLAYAEYDEKTLDMIFKPSNQITEFYLDYEELKRIGSLSKLSTNPDTQKSFVEFYVKDGHLYATDNAFDLKIRETENEFDGIRLNKNFIGLFCHENYLMKVCETDEGNKILIAESQQSNTVASTVLIDNVTESIEEFDFTNTDFNWDNDEIQ